MADTMFAQLPAEITTPAPQAPPDPAALALLERQRAAQEEARAFEAIQARDNPLAYQQARTHAPTDGNAALAAAGLPTVPLQAPPAAVAPPEQLAAAGPTTPAPARRAGGGAPSAKPDDLEQEAIKAGEAARAGIDKAQEAKAEGNDALARAHEDLRVQQQLDAQEQRDKQEENRRRAEELDRQDAENLKKARDYVIPDFWKGHEAAKIGSIITIAMGGIAQGILGGPNQAAQIINKNIDDYFHKQKEKVDNLYKYAEQTGKANDRTRLRYAQELVDLKDQHAAVQQSVLTHINSVEKKNAANVDRASTDLLKAKLQEDINKQRGEARQLRAQIHLMNAQANAANANAAESRAKAAGATGKADLAVVMDENNRPIGHVTSGRGGAQAFASRDADYARAEHTLQALLEDVEKNGGRVVLPEAAKNRNTLYNNAVIGVATVSPLGKTNEAQHLEAGSIGSSGAYTLTGANPDAIRRKLIEIKNQREQYRNQGLIGYTGAAAAPRPPTPSEGGGGGGGSLPPGLPPGSTATGRKTKDGRAVYRLPNGQLVAG